MKTQLKKIACFSKGQQINGEQLLSNGKYDYLNGGIYPSGKWSDYNVEGDTIAISEGGNSCGYVNYMESNFWCGGHCYYLYDVKCSSKYLYYALKSQQDRIMKLRSGACMPNIKKKDLADFVFEYNDNSIVQKKVVLVLDTLESVILSKQLFVKKLDELIKSRFVEMFGDPVSNSLGWQTILMKRLASKIGSGATPKGGRESYGTEGISLIRSMNVYNGCFEYKDLAYISDDQAKKLENVVIQENDVLLNITGASVARCCIVPDGILPARVNQHVCIIRCNNKIIPKYLCHLLIDDNYQRFLLDLAGSGATREAITKQQIEELSIIIPPIKLQNQFADFVTKVEIQKATVQKSIDKLETLKKSLMQENFG